MNPHFYTGQSAGILSPDYCFRVARDQEYSAAGGPCPFPNPTSSLSTLRRQQQDEQCRGTGPPSLPSPQSISHQQTAEGSRSISPPPLCCGLVHAATNTNTCCICHSSRVPESAAVFRHSSIHHIKEGRVSEHIKQYSIIGEGTDISRDAIQDKDFAWSGEQAEVFCVGRRIERNK